MFDNSKFKDFKDFGVKPKIYTVVVINTNGKRSEYKDITDPWRYIAKVQKDPSVKTAFIKNN